MYAGQGFAHIDHVEDENEIKTHLVMYVYVCMCVVDEIPHELCVCVYVWRLLENGNKIMTHLLRHHVC